VLGLSPRELRDLRRMALLHDIGKLGVSNLILDKPGKLTDEEWMQMRRHPELTVRILERVSAFKDLAATAGAHHERLDGRGYHLGLRDEHLNRDARILAVADVCEALTADRPYRRRWSPTRCARSCAATFTRRSATRRSARSRRRASSGGWAR